MENKETGFATKGIHAGHSPDPVSLSRAVPLYRTSSFVFKSVEHAANLFALKEFGNIYSRLGNPTNDMLEARVSAMEGGAASVSVASGTSAIFNTIITIARTGDEIVAATNLYGGTYTMFDAILPDMGINCKFVSIQDLSAWEQAITDKTRLLYLESIGNPALDVADIEAVSRIAKKHHLPLVVDGTFSTPYLLKTIEHGADIVINSLTKWMGGHGTAIGGIVTDAGSFDWSDPKFTLFNQADKNYHGLRWAQDLPPELAKIAFALRFRTVPLRNLGACLSPDNAWLFMQGLETLELRMQRHCENALKVAEYLEKHPKCEWVRYPGLKSDPSFSTAQKYLHKGYGSMVVCGLKSGFKGAVRLIEGLKLFSHLANVGDAKSLALHPGSTSHSQLSEEQQRAGGLKPELIRLSIGLESIEDILGDLEQALNKL